MKVAFLILAHAYPRLAGRLIDRLCPHGDVFIHVDAKSDIKPFKESVGNNAVFVDRRSVRWGGASMVEATMCLVEAAFAKGGYDYYSLHSGVDYPVRPVGEFVRTLREGNGFEYIDCFPFPADNKVRYEERHLLDFKKNRLLDRGLSRIERWLKRLPKRSMYKNWISYKGAQWFTVTEKFILGVHACWQKDRALRAFTRTTFCPDEWFFQTVAVALGFTQIINSFECLRYVDWSGKRGDQYPAVLVDEDFADILSHPAFFARKMDPVASARLLDMLDEHIGARG